MKTKTEWDQDIINKTAEIHQKFPELSKYIVEIPVTRSEKEEVNIKNLADYYHSLEEIVKRYEETHSGALPKKI